jgi:hypothetical protein
MALADAISTPQVGQTMLKTFATLSEENRRRKELDINQQKLVQGLAMKEAAQDIRERALSERARQFDERHNLATQAFELKEIESNARTGLTNLNAAKVRNQLLAETVDVGKASLLSDLINNPGDDGKPPLVHRMLSMDEKTAQEAYREFAQVAIGNVGKKGGQVDELIRHTESLLKGAQADKYAAIRASVAAEREKRMAADQQADNTRADASLEERKRANAAREAKVGTGGAGSTKSGAATVTRTTVSPEKDAKTVIKGTPAQIAAAKRIEELAKEPETFVNALGETKAQEIARLNAILSPTAAAPADAGVTTAPPPAVQKPNPGEIRQDAKGRKARWVGGTTGDVNDPVNWQRIP